MSVLFKRYAQALFSKGADKGVLNDLETLALSFEGEVWVALTSPVLSREEKWEMLSHALISCSETVKGFMHALVQNNRLPFFHGIFKAYKDLYQKQEKRAEGTLISAVSLSGKEVAQLEAYFSRELHKKITLQSFTDPDLVGGIVVDVEGCLFDYSLKTKLEKLHIMMSA